MDSTLIAALGIAGMFALILLHVQIGIAMAIAGVLGVAALIGWGPALSLLGTETVANLSSTDLAVIPSDGQLCLRRPHVDRNLFTGPGRAGTSTRRPCLCHDYGLCRVWGHLWIVPCNNRNIWTNRAAGNAAPRV